MGCLVGCLVGCLMGCLVGFEKNVKVERLDDWVKKLTKSLVCSLIGSFMCVV